MRRLPHLDVLRGVAMLGILPVNLLYMAYPVERLQPSTDWGDPPVEVAAHAYVAIFHELEFITLFSLLFGAGMALAFRSAGEQLDAYAPRMLRRLFLLWPIGVLHGVFLWQGDILSTYAPLGLFACWFVLVPRAVQVVLGLLGLAGSLGLIVLFASLDPDTSTWQQGWQLAAYAEGTYAEVVRSRTVDWLWVMSTGIFAFGGRLGGLFLLGIAVVQAGWLDTVSQHRGRWMAAAAVGLTLGLGGETLAWWLTRPGDDLETAALVLGESIHYVASLVLAAGYAATIVLLVERLAGAARLAPFEAVGRTAFSNYVLQSLLMNLVFLPSLGGLYGELTHTELLGVAAAIWGVELVVSVVWLRWFHRGPLEWIWRSLTYWRLEPVLRQGEAPATAPPPGG